MTKRKVQAAMRRVEKANSELTAAGAALVEALLTKYSYRELGRLVGVSTVTILHIRKGKSEVTPRIARKLMDVA